MCDRTGRCVLTCHLHHVGRGVDPPDTDEALSELRRLLRQRMRRRGLLDALPKCLGYPDIPAWRGRGTFDEIIQDCYFFAVWMRRQGLVNQARFKPVICGLVIRNIDNFLGERQRRHDPVGYAVFGNVEAAVRRGVAGLWLTARGLPGGRLRSETRVRFTTAGAAGAASPARLEQEIAASPGWPDIQPDLERTSTTGQDWLVALLHRLSLANVGAFRCGDLVSRLAAPIRSARGTPHATPTSELVFVGEGRVELTLDLDTSLEDQERWERFKTRAERIITNLSNQPRRRDGVAQVFRALVEAIESGDERAVSQAALIRKLDGERSTISGYFGLLREVVFPKVRDEMISEGFPWPRLHKPKGRRTPADRRGT